MQHKNGHLPLPLDKKGLQNKAAETDTLQSDQEMGETKLQQVFGKGLPLTPPNILRLQRTIGNQSVMRLIMRSQSGATAIMRKFDKDKPSTYDDDGGHALLEHSWERTEDSHKARAKINPPTNSSSGWANEAKMKAAVKAAHVALLAWPDKKKSKGNDFKAKFTCNVTQAGSGYTWSYTDPAKENTMSKTVLDTAVVIFQLDAGNGSVVRMVTAFPGGPAKDFQGTATV